MHVLVVDDHPLIRAALKAILLNLDPGVTVVEAGTAHEALEQGRRDAAIDVVLLDLMLPDVGGIDALVQVKELFDGIPVVVVSARRLRDQEYRRCRRDLAGAAAGPGPRRVRARPPAGGHGWHGRPVAHVAPAVQPAPAGGAGRPAARQVEQGDRPRPGRTVKAHLWAIYQVLGVSTRLQAFERCHKLGLIGSVRLDGRPAQ